MREQFGGERVIWSGLVTSVEQEGDGYRMEVVMDDPDSHGQVSLNALRHGANENRVLQLRRGDQR
ncbi:MAG: hypothetical protein FVQ81_08405 [Candidatus Glassbacteria bacterium]|nr:hypothetical protein [Candidatus Glassbacteria bacterium]